MAMNLGSWATRSVATVVVATDGTGDTTDIQTGINLLPATGGVVYVKEGIYTITSAIEINKSNVSLIGAGRSTKIETAADIKMFHADSVDFLVIEKFFIWGSGSGNVNNYGIYFDSVTNSIIRECWIENTGNCCIYNENCYFMLIFGNFLDLSDNDAIYTFWCADVEIQNNFVTRCLNPIKIERCFDTIILGNDVGFSTGSGINCVWCARSDITSNLSSINDEYGIIVDASSDKTIIVGNHCFNNTLGGLSDLGTNSEVGHNITI